MNLVVKRGNELIAVRINPEKGETNIEFAIRCIQDSIILSQVLAYLRYVDNGKVNK